MPKSRRALALAALVAASVAWGAVFLFAALALRQLSPLAVVTARFVIASLVLLPLLLWRREWPERRDWPLVLAASFIGVPVAMLLLFTGIAMAGATVAAILLGAFPVFLSLAAVRFEGERLGFKGWGATFASVLGVALIVGRPGGGASFTGSLLVLASLLCFTAWVVFSQRLMTRYSSFAATSWVILLGTLMLLPVAWLRTAGEGLPSLNGTTWASLLALGVLCTALTYQLWNWGLKEMGAHRSGVIGNLEPLTGAVLGVLVLGEPTGPALWLGGALILGAAISVSL
ncbi:MAG: DMT family transporter [Bacillota bacterium]